MSLQHRIVSQDEWLAAHLAHLQKEKALTRQRDQLSAERRRLPWVAVSQPYVFDAPEGRRTLADLFGGCSQLVIYHFMYGPKWEEGCPSCSMAAEHLDANVVHLAQRDVALAVVSRAMLPQIESFKARMGWHFPWVSSHNNDFNRDFHVSFTEQEMAAGQYYNFGTRDFPRDEAPGLSVFSKDENGHIYRTFSTFARGAEWLLGVYSYLDLVPKGRNEAGLPFPMAWVRHRDKYAPADTAECGCKR